MTEMDRVALFIPKSPVNKLRYYERAHTLFGRQEIKDVLMRKGKTKVSKELKQILC